MSSRIVLRWAPRIRRRPSAKNARRGAQVDFTMATISTRPQHEKNVRHSLSDDDRIPAHSHSHPMLNGSQHRRSWHVPPKRSYRDCF